MMKAGASAATPASTATPSAAATTSSRPSPIVRTVPMEGALVRACATAGAQARSTTTATDPLSASTYATSSAARRKLTGTTTAPSRRVASQASISSRQFRPTTATRSPGRTPFADSTIVSRVTRSFSCEKVHRRRGSTKARSSGRTRACPARTSLSVMPVPATRFNLGSYRPARSARSARWRALPPNSASVVLARRKYICRLCSQVKAMPPWTWMAVPAHNTKVSAA